MFWEFPSIHGYRKTSRYQSSESERKSEACRSIDIRNSVDLFAKLENCTVIEGSLAILLIDYADSSEYEKLSFPHLVEITDYLLLYRVFGLKKISHIFPNLTVIRGQRLFFNYALVAFEMPDLEEMALPSLTRIMRGAIRLEKNPNLCYVETIDWTKIANVSDSDNFIVQNKAIDECVNVCPGDEALGSTVCPVKSLQSPSGAVDKQALCWNSQHCQKVCPDRCGKRACYKGVNERGEVVAECCDEQCLGGCTGPTPNDCTACTNVVYDGRCQKSCPPGTYQYHKRRCLLRAECKEMRYRGDRLGNPYKILENPAMCIPDCPSGYTESKVKDEKYLCEKCVGPCPRVCQGLTIDNVAAAQKLKGCTVIDGTLSIDIRGGSHVGRELEESLGMIEEVQNYIKVVRSYSLMSLSFLRNLRVIHGEHLIRQRYAMFVLDNQNLQDIWNYSVHPNLTIGNGTVFFHFNRKLCLNKIKEFVKIVGLTNKTDERDISETTNGDQVACDVSYMTLKIFMAKSTHAIIRWTNYQPSDQRELLNFVVNYREAPQKNITIFNARDACGTDSWKSEDVRPYEEAKNETEVASILTNLKPFTQYAVYVQTYTIATANRGAMSSIVYFTTTPDVPTPARDINVDATKLGELHVSWKEPNKPNGNVSHYYVYWQPQALSPEVFDKRNYCIQKLRLSALKKKDDPGSGSNHTLLPDGSKCCECPKPEKERKFEEEERMIQIEFENYLHASLYKKRPSTKYSSDPGRRRKKRSDTRRTSSSKSRNNGLGSTQTTYRNQTLDPANTTINPSNMSANGTEEKQLPEPYQVAIVHGKMETVLPNLKHFMEYSIEVIACHDLQPGKTEKFCSNRAITTARTLLDPKSDLIHSDNITVQNDTGTSVIYIKWPEPPSPNGLIVTYEIEFNKIDGSNFKPDIVCIPQKNYRINGGYKTDPKAPLKPGNWSCRVRTTSLAGTGNWTTSIHFYVAKLEQKSSFNVQLIVGVAVAGALLLIIFVSTGIWFVAKKRFGAMNPEGLYTSANPEYWSTGDVYIPDEWEVPRDKIKLLQELGQGSFGMVWEGNAKNLGGKYANMVRVAVKTVNETASIRERIEFLNEASVMKAFDCNHVVKLIGVVSQGQPTLVVMELMAKGDLKSYLRIHRPEDTALDPNIKPPSLKQILQMAGEIADGMAYLSAKKFVHRDLAARNCMVSESLQVKIGDFGMTRDIYETDYYRKGGKGLLPVRWMSPESLKDGIFTSYSDVWSYGVVLWEMATLATQPYQGLANEQVLKFVIDGGIMEKPEGCPEKLFDLMMKCWQHTPKGRPTFFEIIEMLVPDIDPSFKEVSFFFSEENQEHLREEQSTNDGGDEGGAAGGESFEMDDSRMPLTGSSALLGGMGDRDSQQSMRDIDTSLDQELDDLELDLSGDGQSHHSSLSYQSRHSAGTCRHMHSQPCTCIDIIPDGQSKVKPKTTGFYDWRAPNPPPAPPPGDGRAVVVEPPPLPRRTSTVSGSGGGGENQPNSNEGSKGSSKSSGSSGLNGIANGHIPRIHIPPPQQQSSAQC